MFLKFLKTEMKPKTKEKTQTKSTKSRRKRLTCNQKTGDKMRNITVIMKNTTTSKVLYMSQLIWDSVTEAVEG